MSPALIRSRARAKSRRIGASQSSPSASPNVTAACKLGAEAKVRNWCARAASVASSGAAAIHPIFHPVSEKILPADPHLSVRDAMPSIRAKGMNACPSISRCSHTSSLITISSCARATLATASSSPASNNRPVGLWGLLKMIARVRGVTAAVSESRSMRQPGGCSATSTGSPPALRISGT